MLCIVFIFLVRHRVLMWSTARNGASPATAIRATIASTVIRAPSNSSIPRSTSRPSATTCNKRDTVLAAFSAHSPMSIVSFFFSFPPRALLLACFLTILATKLYWCPAVLPTEEMVNDMVALDCSSNLLDLLRNALPPEKRTNDKDKTLSDSSVSYFLFYIPV